MIKFLVIVALILLIAHLLVPVLALSVFSILFLKVMAI
jgi:hypothetical protein